MPQKLNINGLRVNIYKKAKFSNAFLLLVTTSIHDYWIVMEVDRELMSYKVLKLEDEYSKADSYFKRIKGISEVKIYAE